MSKQINLTITGMSCGHCVQAVSRALLGVTGVESASVDLESGRAVVVAHDDVENASLLAAIAEEEFEAKVAD